MLLPLELPALAEPGEKAGVSLKALGDRKGLEIGSAFSGNADPAYRALIRRHCSVIAPEWQLKPQFLKRGKDGSFDFGPADRIAEFARTNRIWLHGHSLYPCAQGSFLSGAADLNEAKAHCGGIMRAVARHYPEAVSWDVLDEVIGDEGPFTDGLLRKFGLDFADYCFRAAHDAAPQARLVINDYNFECAGDWCGAKDDRLLRIVRALLRKKTPVHAIGIEAHLSSVWKASPRRASRFAGRLGDLGLEVHLSQMDMDDSRFPDDMEERDRLVARAYEDFLHPVLENRNVRRVMFWGISDFDNWMTRPDSPKKRRNGFPRPALFDARNRPKPAFEAVARVLEGAPARW